MPLPKMCTHMCKAYLYIHIQNFNLCVRWLRRVTFQALIKLSLRFNSIMESMELL